MVWSIWLFHDKVLFEGSCFDLVGLLAFRMIFFLKLVICLRVFVSTWLVTWHSGCYSFSNWCYRSFECIQAAVKSFFKGVVFGMEPDIYCIFSRICLGASSAAALFCGVNSSDTDLALYNGC